MWKENHKIFRGQDTPSLYASTRKFGTFVFILLKIDAPQSLVWTAHDAGLEFGTIPRSTLSYSQIFA